MPESVEPQSATESQPGSRAGRGRALRPVAPPPTTFREWEAGLRSLGSALRIGDAIEASLARLSDSQRRRIDRQLPANQGKRFRKRRIRNRAKELSV